MTKSLSDSERIDWIQLIRTQNIGPVSFFRLIKKFGTASNALEMLPEFSRQSGRKTPLIPSKRADAEREAKHAWNKGVQILAACEPEYPMPLRAIADPPPVIFLRGAVNLFEKKAVAIIGARNASGNGQKFARELAQRLGEEDIVIVSGLARGIDGAAHTASLKTGTIAVVAGGIDYIYPPEHDELTRMIANQGLILSERPLGAEPTARDFPRRNRLISGLCSGVVIVEAATKSGTLITARYALEQGREVFAVPGSPLDPRCRGANRLLRDGANWAESAEDILQALAEQNRALFEEDRDLDRLEDLFGDLKDKNHDFIGGLTHENEADLMSLRDEIYQFLGFTPIHRDEILRSIQAPPSYIADALLALTLGGDIEETSGGMFARRDCD